MLTHDAAAPHRVQADLPGGTLLPHTVAVVDILVGLAGHLVDLVRQQQRGAAGGVQLVVMVLLDDLDVVVQPQGRGGLLCQLGQQVDAHGHVRALEHGAAGAGLGQQLFGVLVQAGGADDAGQRVLCAEAQSVPGGRGAGKIDEHIGLHVQFLQARRHGDGAALRGDVHAAHNAAVFTLFDQLAQDLAHAAVDALNDNAGHGIFLLFFLQKARAKNARAFWCSF